MHVEARLSELRSDCGERRLEGPYARVADRRVQAL